MVHRPDVRHGPDRVAMDSVIYSARFARGRQDGSGLQRTRGLSADVVCNRALDRHRRDLLDRRHCRRNRGAQWLRRWWWAVAVTMAAAVAWPCLLAGNRSCWSLGLVAAALLTWAALRIHRRYQGYVAAAAIGAALLLSMALFHGSHSWWDCGFDFGSSRWHWTASSLTDNLPGLLHERFGWSKDPDDVVGTISAIPRRWPSFLQRWQWWPAVDLNLTAKTLFNPIFTFMLLASGVAIGLQARRKTARMLVALTLPWFVFFIFPVEIMGRYMLYPAAVSAICIGEGSGWPCSAFF